MNLPEISASKAGGIFRGRRGRPAPGTPRRLGDALLTTWTLAGGLIAVVFSVGPVEDAVRAAPWLMGPGLWLATALASGALLRAVARWQLSAPVLGAATLVGGAADALVVAAGHPWPGLIVGIAVFSVVVALAGGPVRRVEPPGKDRNGADTKQEMGQTPLTTSERA
jgi:hypothetical protein